MVKFCTNCGNKLGDSDKFCTKCGTKVNETDNYVTIDSKQSFKKVFGSIRNDKVIDEGVEEINKFRKGNSSSEIKNAKKNLKNKTGGFLLKSEFKKELEENDLSIDYGYLIKKQMENEITSGTTKSEDVEKRINQLIIEYKNKKIKYEEESFKYVDELFKGPTIQRKIKEYNINEERTLKIKDSLKKKITEKTFESYGEEEIKKDANRLLDDEKTQMEKDKENELNRQKRELEENKIQYVEDLVKKFCPDSELTSFEKNIIHFEKFKGTYEEIEKKLDEIANKIINNHQKVGKYDFSGYLLEDGGFSNYTDNILIGQKHVKKNPDLRYYVFVKIFENKIEFIGNELDLMPLGTSRSIGGDRIIFYKEINNISISNDTVFLNLNNKEKLKITYIFTKANEALGEEKTDEIKKLEKFYESLNEALMKFKENKIEENTIENKESEINTTDELMKIAELYEKGLLTEEEFTAMKKKLLGL